MVYMKGGKLPKHVTRVIIKVSCLPGYDGGHPVPLDELLTVRQELVRQLQQGLDDTGPTFLVSIVQNRPELQARLEI